MGPQPSHPPSLRQAPEPRWTRRERGENFPVALSVLPRELRADLHAVYAVARTIDDLGDRADGDRTAALHDFRADLHEIWRGGQPGRQVLQVLVPTVRARGLTPAPFDDLIAANLIDQRVTRYDTFADLLGYCRVSADPVGRLVLDIFGQRSPATVFLSDHVCRALQVLEHLQDVAEDRRAGRVYLPLQDLAAFGVAETDLDQPRASGALRQLIAFETDRASRLLASGAPLRNHLHGWARLAVVGYLAGGHAAVCALRRAGFDVLGQNAAVRRSDIARCALAMLPAGPGTTR